ncbi:MAG: hypothetical protein HY231_08005 [Acidobacteria bacterium]|nr:hypothetical protein [Acidobacteriota bacterium]
MTSHKTNCFLTLALALLLTGSALAQGRAPRVGGLWRPPQGLPGRDGRLQDHDRRPGPGRDRPPHGGPPGFNLLSSEMRFDSKVVKGAPYSAQAISENTQVLADGTRITRKSTASIYRDNEGRTRRDLSLDAIGPIANSGDAQQLIFINDPVTGNHYVLYPQNHSGRKMKMSAKEPPPFAELLPMTEGKTEALGKQMIEGVEAEGTRSTITIPAGQIGNDRPIVIVSERWYSDALQAVVLSKHSDPRVGENVYRLQNINRQEPAKALFEVPADFHIEEDSQRPPHRGRRPDEF